MIKKLIIIFFLFLYCSLTIYAQTRADIWKKDINYLKNELASRHKNLFFKADQNTFNQKLDSIIDRVNVLKDIEVSIALQEVIASMGDDHTSIFSPDLTKNGIFPIYLYWFSDGLYVLKAFHEYETLLGTKIIAINNHKIEEITEKLSHLISKTNTASIKNNIPKFIPVVAYLQYYNFIDGNEATIEYENQYGEIKEITITSVQVSNDFRAKLNSFKTDTIPLCELHAEKLFWYNYDINTKILYAQYNKCFSKEAYKKQGNTKQAKNAPSFEKFNKEIISILKSKEVNKFIFDMRFNPGGFSPQGTQLVKQIAEVETINQKGKLFVIVGRKTFSSAIINALDFQNYTNAIFVGEPTGGKPNHYGEVKNFMLPNSGLKVNYSTKYFEYVKEDRNSFYPDNTIFSSYEDLKNGIDPVFEWILKY